MNLVVAPDLQGEGRDGGYFTSCIAMIDYRPTDKILIPSETVHDHVFVYFYRTTEIKEAWKKYFII